MEFTILESQHDAHICNHIGQIVGQTNWKIEHKFHNNSVILVFPDTITQQQVANAIASYIPPVPPPPIEYYTQQELEAEADAVDTLAKAKALLKKLAKAGLRIQK